ncbi:MAG: thiamine pyrophosphate-binding protein [Syntrophales bacterium]
MPLMTGSRYFAEAMRGYGVTHVFFVPAILPDAMAAMEETGITRIVTHGETAAGYMADGYARASGRPGVCLAQAVGSGNLAAGVRDAYLASSPVIAISGGPHPDSRYRHLYQVVEDFPMFVPVTKFNARVDHARRLPDLLRQAFRMATSGAPGPVHLELPGRHGETVAQEAMEYELLFEEAFSRCPVYRPEADPDAVAKAAGLLALAQRPIIVAGGGVAASRAWAEVVELAEKLSLPVATSLAGKGTIPDDHLLSVGVIGTYSRWCANRAVADADLVFFIGSRAGGHTTANWRIPRPGTAVVQLDIDPAEIGRNYPAKAGLCGDARATLRRLIEAVEPKAGEKEWLAHVRQMVGEWRSETEPLLTSDAAPIRPERLCREIGAILPTGGVVVSDTGHAAIWSSTMIDFTKPGQRYIRCAGTLGWALPASIGAKCALPDKPVFCFTGDGGLYFHLSELETAARMGINVVVVVNNNRSLQQVKSIVDGSYGGNPEGKGRDLWMFRETNFAEIAENMGCLGLRVERPGNLRSALKRALEAAKPVVVDVVTDIGAIPQAPWC